MLAPGSTQNYSNRPASRVTKKYSVSCLVLLVARATASDAASDVAFDVTSDVARRGGHLSRGVQRADEARLQSELRGSQGVGVVSSGWLDRVSLNSSHLQTLMLTDVQTPFLGTPLVALGNSNRNSNSSSNNL